MGKLIAGGDSFTYGSELLDCHKLADSEHPMPYEVISNLTYTALIAKELGVEYVCAAFPGHSNSAIRRTTMDMCEQHQDIDLVIVMWTFPNRYEFRFNDKWEQITVWSADDHVEVRIKKEFKNENNLVFNEHLARLQRARDLGITDFAKNFYRHVGHTEFWECYTSLTEILMLSNYLKLRNIPYVFTLADSCILHNQRHTKDQSYKNLLRQINDMNWFLFPHNKGFYNWAQDEKFPFGTTHPLEEAHIEAANLIYEHIRHISRIS